MPRQPSTTRTGVAFSAETIQAVWSKGVASTDPNKFRKDACGAWIRRDLYGSTTQYGWEIDHIKPVASGGTDDLANLQPLYWENNRHKADDYPSWNCKTSG